MASLTKITESVRKHKRLKKLKNRQKKQRLLTKKKASVFQPTQKLKLLPNVVIIPITTFKYKKKANPFLKPHQAFLI